MKTIFYSLCAASALFAVGCASDDFYDDGVGAPPDDEWLDRGDVGVDNGLLERDADLIGPHRDWPDRQGIIGD